MKSLSGFRHREGSAGAAIDKKALANLPGRQRGVWSGQAAATGEPIARAAAQVKLTFMCPL
jgi:hypothetical protein